MSFIDPHHRHRPRTTVGLALPVLVALVLIGLPLGVRPAAAYPTSTVELRGHGWGHGRGMGQYGAIGYARDHGWSATQILGHFYGGTRAGTISEDRPANPAFTVELSGERAKSVWVTAAGGLSVPGLPIGTPVKATAWMAVRVAADTWDLFAGGSCTEASSRSANAANKVARVTGRVRFLPSTDTASTTAAKTDMAQSCRTLRHYRGELQAAEHAAGAATLNVLPLESYLWGSVPQEMGPYFPVEALKAQAVAARSYALSRTLNSTFAGCDTACGLYQAYDGADVEAAASTGAVVSTAGVIRRRVSDARVARTEYSSSNGGWSVAGDFPAVEDLGDIASPRHSWNASVPVTAIEQRYQLGTLQSISIDERDGNGDMGGRVLKMTLRFSNGATTITGDAFRAAFTTYKVFSRWFEIVGGPIAPQPIYAPVAPARVMDTRPGGVTIDAQAVGGGALRPGETRALQVTGRAGVPASGVGAVVLNVTATGPTTGGFVTVHPTGQPRPGSSNLNFVAGQTIPNLVIAKVGTTGQVSLYNDSGSTHLIADVAGWFPA